MSATSLTLSYDALLSTTLFNYKKTMVDNIGKENVLIYTLQKMDGGWSEEEISGERAAYPLMYALGSPDSYEGLDQLDTTPMDGVTTAFYNWGQASVPVAISGLEEKMNRGQERIVNLLQTKIKQAEMGLMEWFAKAIFWGEAVNDGTSLTSAYVSPSNGSTFIDPLLSLVRADPTTSTTIGRINQSTNSWWQNKYDSSAATTYAGLRGELRALYNTCSKGTGGKPNLHICDQTTFELYEQSLESLHQNPSYQKADIPFDNLLFRGHPTAWDEIVPDAQTPATNTTTKGTWLMLNTKFIGVKVDKDTNFAPGPFVKPENQDGKVAQILFLGALGCSNRRKQGILFNIARTLS